MVLLYLEIACTSVLASPLKPATPPSVRAHGEGFAFATSAVAKPEATINNKQKIGMEWERRGVGSGMEKAEQVTGLASYRRWSSIRNLAGLATPPKLLLAMNRMFVQVESRNREVASGEPSLWSNLFRHLQ